MFDWVLNAHLLSVKNKKINYIKAPLWIGFNCLKATEPLRGNSLVFTTQSLGVPGTYFINLRR